jgi:hypothetical protein
MTLERHAALCGAAERCGLVCRGGFHPTAEDAVPSSPKGRPMATVVLLGLVGSRQWGTFTASPENRDGAADPLDRWSRRVIDALAHAHGATALYPFGGPPWLPFQRWAQRAEGVHVSPLNILIHPVYGLWHSYRGALGFAEPLELPPAAHSGSPCATCAAKPCLTVCPADAVRPGHLDHMRCRTYLRTTSDGECIRVACRARASCPVGAEYRFGPEQARFHMAAFIGLPRGTGSKP